jgi:hypothetical protein
LVADDLSGFWGVPNRGIGMRPEVPRANGVGVMGIRAVQAGALTSAIDRPLPGDHPEMEDFARRPVSGASPRNSRSVPPCWRAGTGCHSTSTHSCSA